MTDIPRGGAPDPTVDVIVATNRAEPFLRAALDSVRAQSYRSWRLIVVDDGSATPDAIDRIVVAVDPSAVVMHQDNAGPSAARNAAMRVGAGELVTFLDDDDLWPVDRLADLVRALADRPDAPAAFGDGLYVDGDGEVFGGWHTEPASPERFLSGATPIPRITALMVRRTVLDRVGGFDETLRYAEDDELILRILRDGPMVSTGSVVVSYRRHDRNATLADWRLRYRSGIRAIDANIRDARSHGDRTQMRLLRRNRRRYRAATAGDSAGRAIGHVRTRDLRAAMGELWSSARISPLGLGRGLARKAASRLRSSATIH